MPLVRNPILPGFNPDPSVLRVGSDYYIATSTFEWYPGVQIHHSTDLANWTLLTRPLTRASQLDMRGDPDSCGVWAPCLTHDGSKFWLVYTDVKRKDGSFKDSHNYIVTADAITGPWSDPIYTNSSGFDPSLFHDDDGKKYFINMLWDHRKRPHSFAGIALQEFDPSTNKLTGPRKNIFAGSDLALVEGPHLYKRKGWYYLLTAEGGTGYDHAVTLCRSRSIAGPYELHPQTHILTSKDHPLAPLQRAGHGDIVDTPDGRTYLVHLTGRPTTQLRRCVLGRETAIQEAFWADDDWLYVKSGPVPSLYVDLPAARDDTPYWAAQSYTFSAPDLPIDFQWLRTPEPDTIFSLTARPGYLRLHGRETIGSLFTQALVARRQQAFCYSASTRMEFHAAHFQHAAGLVAYYNSAKFHYFHVSHDDQIGRHLRVMSALPDSPQADAFTAPIPVPPGPIELRAEVDYERLRFAWRIDGVEWQWLPEQFDASILSDEATAPGQPNFTGAFVGMACQDMSGAGNPADFDWFEYRERAYAPGPG